MMKVPSIRNLLILVLLGGIASCDQGRSLETVSRVDVERYLGKWYEIARLPTSFEKDCACVTATYGMLEDGNLSVKNSCNDTVDQRKKSSEGKAFVVEGSNNSQLKVQFFFPFKGDYYIIALADDYSYALVGAPNREYLWILSRTESLPSSTIEKLKSKADSLGFDSNQLIYTKQNCTN